MTDGIPTNGDEIKSDIELQSCTIAFQIHPQPVLTKIQLAHQFSLGLSKYLNVQNTKTDSNSWIYEAYFSGMPECKLSISIQPAQISISLNVTRKMSEEWIEQRFQFALEEFARAFEPQVMMGQNFGMVGIIDLKSDARQFLAEKVMRIEPNDFNKFERPFGLIGLHFVFPPFMVRANEADKVTDWQCDVKIESLANDPNKLWIALTAQWMDGAPWAQAVNEGVQKRLGTAINYLKGCISRFINKSPNSPNGEGHDHEN